MVFPGLPAVICGKAVHKLVDNLRKLRATTRFLWTECGQKKNTVILPQALARRWPARVEILSPLETGTAQEETQGTWQGPGNR